MAGRNLSIDQALQEAVAHHRAGALTEAAEVYRTILAAQPAHPDANHNLGVVAMQRGIPADGLPYLRAALDADPANGQYWLSYIEALIQSGQVDLARQTLADARPRGLQGPEVEAMAARLGMSDDGARGAVSSDTAGSLPEARDLARLLAVFREGRYQEVVDRARCMTRDFPTCGAAWKLLGAALKQQGRSDEALQPMQRATESLPDDAEAHSNLGVALQDAGRMAEAENCFRCALRLRPDHVAAHYNLGFTLHELGRSEEAIASYREAIRYQPDHADAHYNLACVLQAEGRLDEAIAAFRETLRLAPDSPRACCNLGNALKDQGRLDEAVASYRRALSIDPGYADAYSNLVFTLDMQVGVDTATLQAERRRWAEACTAALGDMAPSAARPAEEEARMLIEAFRAACYVDALVQAQSMSERFPGYGLGWKLLGATLKQLGRSREALVPMQKAAALLPGDAETHNNLGTVLQDLGRAEEAEAAFRRALRLDPDDARIHYNLGYTLHYLARLEEAVACYRRAIELKPDYSDAYSNLIFSLDMMDGANPQVLQAARRQWSAACLPAQTVSCAIDRARDVGRRLRIGYVSGDFRIHSAATVFGAMLVDFDPAAFEVFAYANSTIEDERTRLFQRHVTGWRNIAGWSDEAVADLIRQDGIDILVDLSGHSGGNRLLVFARKPAPIQITAWGYIGGTGMPVMDVFLADPVVVPPEEKSLYAEEVIYLSSVVSAFFPDVFPGVDALPARTNRHVTFGSFSRQAKISAESWRAWGRILSAVPDSRLVLKSHELDEVGMQQRIFAMFREMGIDAERIILLGGSRWREHVEAWRQVDLALDPFPHGGGVTLLEGLMMGVPAVALRWPTLVGRLSSSILTTIGLTDWIAETQDQYVDLAIRKARNLSELAVLRCSLRDRLQASIIGDRKAYVAEVERIYRKLWQEACRK